MDSPAFWVVGLVIWLAVIGLAELAGTLAAKMRQYEAELAELAEPTEAELGALGHLFLTGMTAAEMVKHIPRGPDA